MATQKAIVIARRVERAEGLVLRFDIEFSPNHRMAGLSRTVACEALEANGYSIEAATNMVAFAGAAA